MARPKADPEQRIRAYHLWREGHGPAAIIRTLYDEWGDEAVKERTVATWVKEFKALKPETVNLDAPFEWHRLEEYGLPWEAGQFTLKMWRYVQKDMSIHTEGKIIRMPPPTVRQVKWCWRVHLATPTTESESEIWHLAVAYADRELAHEVLAEQLVMDDLDAWLAYGGWDSADRYDEYTSDVEKGYIPQYQRYPGHSIQRLVDDAWEKLEDTSNSQVPENESSEPT